MERNLFLKQIMLLFLFVFSFSLMAQTTVFKYENTTETIPNEFVLHSNSGSAIDRSTYLLLSAGEPGDEILTSNLDLSMYAYAVINVRVATFGSHSIINPLKIEISLDGGDSWMASHTTTTPSGSIYIDGGPIVLNQSFSSETRLRFSNPGVSGRGVRIQNLELIGYTENAQNPVVTAANFTGVVGQSFFQQIEATGPAFSYSTNDELPAGLVLNSKSGVISGIPSLAGSFNVNITAENHVGSDTKAFHFNINKGIQTISGLKDMTKVENAEPFNLPEFTNAGLPIIYASSDPAVATVSGHTVTVAGAGTAVIHATQNGDANWNSLSESINLKIIAVRVADNIVISQIYGGGGNSGAPYQNDYIELYNPTSNAISVNGWSLQYAGASGSTWYNKVDLPDTVIPAGKYFLFKLSGGTNGNSLPGYDAEGSIQVAAASGKTALVNSTSTLKGSCPVTDVSVIDFVGFGTANCFEGSSGAPSGSATLAILRKDDGKQDYNDNGIDFVRGTPNPRSSFDASAITWDGTAWSNTTGPHASAPATINGNYIGAGFTAKSLTVNVGNTLEVTSGDFQVADVENNGIIIVGNGVNFIQTGAFTAGSGSAFIVKVDSKPLQRLDYISWSSPMKNSAQTLKEFSYGNTNGAAQSASGTLDARFYVYDTSNSTYVTISPTGTFAIAQGYQIRVPNDFTTTGQVFHGLFTGKTPNAGNITYTASGTGQFVFLGNPYPGSLDISKFLAANINTTGTVYIWNSEAKMDANNEYSGTTNYNTYNAAGSVPAGRINDHIATGQGFFIERINAQTIFEFTDVMRSVGNAGVFSKTKTLSVNRFWLQMQEDGGSASQVLMAFIDGASKDKDLDYDARMFDFNSDVMYTKVNDERMIIDTHGKFDAQDSFEVYINTAAAKTFTVSLAQKEGIFATKQPVYLRDKVTGKVTEITKENYSFTSAGTGEENRFELMFAEPKVLSVDHAEVQETKIYGSNGLVTVQSTKEIVRVSVYDMSGRLLVQKNAKAKSLETQIGKSVPFVLVVVELADNSKVSKKVKV